MKRRNFIENAALSGAGLMVGKALESCTTDAASTMPEMEEPKVSLPIVLATWNFPRATQKAGEVLQAGNSILDALEQGCMVEEADENNQTVGIGGRPDRDGNVTLDACMMNKDGDCGSVVAMENVVHAISVARKVMEDTPHVMLAGKGAEDFAVSTGQKRVKLLTDKSRKEWEAWKKEANYQPIINIENHDTIGMLGMDHDGNIAGACTTSGLGYKMNGRVGDSPIIGAGLFVDNEVGGCVATGMGEEVVKTVGSFLVVELMRQGKSPQEACEEAIRRIIDKPNSNYRNFQVAYIALNKKGETGSYCIHEGFSMSKFQNGKNENIVSNFAVR